MMDNKDQKDEDYIIRGVDLTLALPAPQAGSSATGEIEFTAQDYKTALRLLLGAALEANDELRYRLKTWLVAVQQRERESGAAFSVSEGRDGSPLLYTAFGLLLKSADYLNAGASTAGHVAGRATSLVSRLAKPITHSWVLRPVRRRYHALGRRWDAVVTPLEETGRAKARSSRALVRQEINEEIVEELLIYLVERSKMREMIEETSAELGSDALTEMRGRSASVDSSLDELVDNILKRQKPKTPPSDPLS
jgi:hypothetical protein